MHQDKKRGWSLPAYKPPNFNLPVLANAPAVHTEAAPADGIAPEGYHATSNHPEYLHLGKGEWLLVPESRMDAVLVLRDRRVDVIESRRILRGDPVVIGRHEDGQDGIYVHTEGFIHQENKIDKFAFRTRGTRETPFSRSYDELYQLLRHEREHGYIVWVLGPAVAFDRDSRYAMQELISHGYCHAIMAGNALAVHDLEAALYGTGLGQDIYNQSLRPHGHYHHLETINRVNETGSITEALKRFAIKDGIIYACEDNNVPYLLAGSIRDDGPLKGVITDTGVAQDEMRSYARRATTVLALATQLHSIAFGNMIPSYQVHARQGVRPVYFFIVDMSEFSADKLSNRGTAQAKAILTNVQDFLINLWRNLG